MSLKLKLLILVWIIVLFSSTVFAYLYNDLLTKEYINGIDNKLYTSAHMAKAILPADYHDKLVNRKSISEQNYLKTIDQFNQICKATGLQYLWSNLFLDDKIVFTSSTSTSKDINNGDHALFFDIHSNPQAFASVRSSKATHYSTFENEWGKGRMVLIPFHDSHGRMYVFGASISIAELNPKIVDINFRTGIVFTISLLLGTFISILAANKVLKPLSEITQVANKIADGQYGEQVTINKDSPELATLANSINVMSEAIQHQQAELKSLLEQNTDKLIDSENYITQVIENMAEGLVTIDEYGIIEKINPATTKMFGFKKEELIGESVSKLLPESSRFSHDNYVKNAPEYLPKVQFIARELKGRRKDGILFPLEISLSTMQTKESIKYVAILHDIADRIKSREILEKAKEEAENANQVKSDFLASMSHELRTPLNSILGFSQLLKLDTNKPLNESQSEAVKHIYKAGQHLLSLIDEVLELAKIEAGKTPLKLEPLPLKSLLDETILLIRPLLGPKDIDLIEPDQLPSVAILADFKSIKQVLLNLLSNAIKYGNKSSNIYIDIELNHSNRLRIAVIDEGIGIPIEHQSEIFKPFTRIGADNNKIEGTGIGLTISKKLMEMMNGSIDFISREGEGSTFWLYIPLADNSIGLTNTSEPATKVVSPNEQGRANNTQKNQVLYIEDNLANIQLIQNFVDMLPNVRLITAENAELGIEIIIHENIDLVLMDINLPGMDGMEAVTILKTRPEFSHVPIVAISANAMPEAIEQGISAGFDDYLTKPIQLDSILKWLEKIKGDSK